MSCRHPRVDSRPSENFSGAKGDSSVQPASVCSLPTSSCPSLMLPTLSRGCSRLVTSSPLLRSLPLRPLATPLVASRSFQVARPPPSKLTRPSPPSSSLLLLSKRFAAITPTPTPSLPLSPSPPTPSPEPTVVASPLVEVLVDEPAPPRTWVEDMPNSVRPYLYLIRIDKPIGTWLLFWPCGESSSSSLLPQLSSLELTVFPCVQPGASSSLRRSTAYQPRSPSSTVPSSVLEHSS